VNIETQVALPAALTPALTPAGTAGPAGHTSHFGLAMRFHVTFTSGDGVQSLGEWSACKGLKVEFRTETVKQGGEYGYEYKLPVQVAYGPVTLERAMQQHTSRQLQTWLSNLVNNWMNSAETDGLNNPPAGDVAIELQDGHQNAVASWRLRNAFPVSWSGPALDAKGAAIAIESLTLEHQGFLPSDL
jgi:phage tail-like protein